MKEIAVIGSGSWGVSLAMHLSKKGHNIRIWSYSEEETQLINKERRCKFLPGIRVPDNIICTTKYEEAINESKIILHVTPSKVTRKIVKEYKQYVTNQVIVICSKGFEKDTLYTLDEILHEELPNNIISILSGPSHAEEVSRNVPTAIVVACEDDDSLRDLQDIFMSEDLRVYTSKDVKGVELGGALKNIIAFCAGLVKSLEFGDNTFAALITRGLAEISKLGCALGGNKDTFYGLTGLGDLIVTCLSEHSRNRKAGVLIGQGKTIEEVRKEVGMTIESIDNIEVAYKLAKMNNIEMPIVEASYNVLYNNLNPKEAVVNLMTREKKFE